MMDQNLPRSGLAAFGVPGLDDVLGGGLAPHRLYLLEGAPGSGKTTLALQFLLEGAGRGEKGLYVTLSETAEELDAVAASHGWRLGNDEGVAVFELAAAEDVLRPDREQTLLHPWEVELGETIKLITDEVERTGAARVAFDSLSEMRLLAQDPLRYRRQILALKQFFAGRKITLLLLDDLTSSGGQSDLQLHSLAHGVVSLHRTTLDYGTVRRRVEVVKMRGAPFREGWHDYQISTGGVAVFPRLVAAEHHAAFAGDPLPSGNAGLDALLDGGPLRGTCTLVSGPAGAGKTTLALQYICAAAGRGERSVMYQFDERRGTLLARAAKLGMDLAPRIQSGLVSIRQVDAASVSPGEFTRLVRSETEAADPARVVVIDSLNGYLLAMPQEQQLVLHLRELIAFLNQRGAATFLLNPQQGLIGTMRSNLEISYIADTVLLLRFFEAGGRVRKALSVIKNRGGAHEDTIREVRITAGQGVQVGEPLTAFRGVLSGTPSYSGDAHPLLDGGGERAGTPDA